MVGKARRHLLTKQGYYPGVVAKNFNVWDWDASNISTLFQDAGITPVTANGQSVYTWRDGVQGVDAVQATEAKRPTYITDSLNGLPVLSFDGGDLLTTTNIGIGTFAIWAVFRASNNAIVHEHSAFVNVNAGHKLQSGASGSLAINRGTLAFKNGTDLTDNTYRVVRLEYDDTIASFKYYGNNVDITTSASATEPGTGTATSALNIGDRNSGGLGLIGAVGQVCVVSPYPGAGIIASMEAYINGRWGVY